MRRPRHHLLRLLGLLLLLGWSAATVPHARALAAWGGAMRVELCSTHGPRSILVDRDGKPVPREIPADCCDLCPTPAAAPPPAPAIPPAPAGHALVTAAPDRPGLPPLPPRAPPQLSRAPPIA